MDSNHDLGVSTGRTLFSLIGDDDFHVEGSGLYSLIDGAKFTDLSRISLPKDGSVTLYSLLDTSADDNAIYAGPILLKHENSVNCPVLRRLNEMPDSPYFLSLIISGVSVSNLVQKLTWLTDVSHDDGSEWVMRYYDPIILPHWLSVLESAQRNEALAGIQKWVYFNHRLLPESVGGDVSSVCPRVQNEQMVLSQKQCDELIDLTLPYMLIHQLENDDPSALDKIRSSDRYDFFSLQLRNAHHYRLASPVDLKAYCLLALMFGENFDRIPLLTKKLSEVNDGNSFSDLVLSWTDEEWKEIESYS